MSDSEFNSETGKEIKTETIDNLKDEIERIVLTFDAVEPGCYFNSATFGYLIQMWWFN